MSRSIQDFYIAGFRAFERLEWPGIGQVNLIVGRNNAGKTALLDALQLYFSDCSPEVLNQMVCARHDIVRKMFARRVNNDLSPLCVLFHGYTLPPPKQSPIVLGPLQTTEQRYRLYIQAYATKDEKGGGSVRRPIEPEEITAYDEVQYSLVAEYSDAIKEICRSFTPRIMDRQPTDRFAGMLPSGGLSDVQLVSLWDKIVTMPAEKDALRSLRLIDDSLEDIAFIADDDLYGSDKRIPVVKTSRHPERIPLKSYGDGMHHLLAIALCLANAENGFLLIDELAAGLHWSVMKNVWRMIFETAAQRGIQLFATTHSRDVITSFYDVWAEHASAGAFVRIGQRDQKHSITPYALDELREALETDTEMR
jgi:ABC-type cobalamin/Fe3+-siderophores transport system ATPase subunit